MEFYFFLALYLGLLAGTVLAMKRIVENNNDLLLAMDSHPPTPRRYLKSPVTREDYIDAYRNNTAFYSEEKQKGGMIGIGDFEFPGIESELTAKPKEGQGELSPSKGGSVVNTHGQVTGIELLKIPVVIGENDVQRMEISDLDLDFTAQKIRHIDAQVNDITYEILNHKVIIQGSIQKQIFYVGIDNVVHHQEEETLFSFFVDVPGAEPGMTAQIYPRVEFIRPELIQEGDVLHQKMVIEIFVKVTEIRQMFLETAVDGAFVKVERVIGENVSQVLVEGQVDLPIPAVKITDIDAQVTDILTEVIEDKVIVQGVIQKQIFFIGEDDVEHHFSDSLSFSHFIDIPGAEPGMNVQLYPAIEHIKPELAPDGETLNQEVVLELFVKVTETVQINLAVGGQVLVKVPQIIGENVRQVMLESTLTLDQPAIKVKEVEAAIENIRSVVLSGKVIIQGIIHKQVFFIGQDNIEYHQAEELPFSTFVDVVGAEPGMDAQIQTRVEHIHHEFNEVGDVLHQKVVLEFFVKVTEEVQINVRPVEVQPYEPYLE